jgi:hypothetical protein
MTPKHKKVSVKHNKKKESKLTRRGTSLLIMSCTFDERLALFEKLTRYFKEKVSETCWFISMKIPWTVSSSSSTPFPFFDLVVLGFLLGFPTPFVLGDRSASKSSFKTQNTLLFSSSSCCFHLRLHFLRLPHLFLPRPHRA